MFIHKDIDDILDVRKKMGNMQVFPLVLSFKEQVNKYKAKD